MIRFYFHPTPNPAKIALFLEEAGLPYEVIPVDTSKGEQHTPAFRAINPNGKVPAIVDTDRPRRQGDARLRFHRDPALSGGEDRQVPRLAGGPAEAAVLAAVHRLRPRPVLRPGRAFPVRRARRPRLCREPLSTRGRAALSGAERSSRRTDVHRRRYATRSPTSRPGDGSIAPRACARVQTIRWRRSPISSGCSRRSMRVRRSPAPARSARTTSSRRSTTRRPSARSSRRTIPRRPEPASSIYGDEHGGFARLYAHRRSGPGTSPAAAPLRTSIARSPGRRMTRSCRSAATRCSSTRSARPTA